MVWSPVREEVRKLKETKRTTILLVFCLIASVYIGGCLFLFQESQRAHLETRISDLEAINSQRLTEISDLEREFGDYQRFFNDMLIDSDAEVKRYNAGREVTWNFELGQKFDSAILYVLNMQEHYLRHFQPSLILGIIEFENHTIFSTRYEVEFSFNMPEKVGEYLCVLIFLDGEEIVEKQFFKVIADRLVITFEYDDNPMP